MVAEAKGWYKQAENIHQRKKATKAMVVAMTELGEEGRTPITGVR